MGGLGAVLRGRGIMTTPPPQDRGRPPALDGSQARVAILARISVGAASWKWQSPESATILQHCWWRDSGLLTKHDGRRRTQNQGNRLQVGLHYNDAIPFPLRKIREIPRIDLNLEAKSANNCAT